MVAARYMQLKQLSRVIVRFNPWQQNGKSAREFLSRCQSPSAAASNPDCKVSLYLSMVLHKFVKPLDLLSANASPGLA